jgi:thymidylate kinase
LSSTSSVPVGVLIILRGPPGAGKKTIRDLLMKRLGTDRTYDLDLDWTGEEFRTTYLAQALDKENIIGRLFYGASLTKQPEEWISKFKDSGYVILSVVLSASLETYIQRVQTRGHDYKDREEMQRHFKTFQEIKNTFAGRAGVEEIIVTTEGKTSQDVADEILEHLNL